MTPGNSLSETAVRKVHPDKQQLTEAVAAQLLDVIAQTLRTEQEAHVVLTGGSVGIGALKACATLLHGDGVADIQWARVHFWFGDERFLPAGDPERNETQAREALLDALIGEFGLPPQNVHAVAASDTVADCAEAAKSYARDLQATASDTGNESTFVPPFAVHLLGVGPDGHINSLFPGKETLHISSVTTAAELDSPKPPAQRVTLTFQAVNSARRVWPVVAGADKAAAVAAAFNVSTTLEEIPALAARGQQETLWHIDTAAASQL